MMTWDNPKSECALLEIIVPYISTGTPKLTCSWNPAKLIQNVYLKVGDKETHLDMDKDVAFEGSVTRGLDMSLKYKLNIPRTASKLWHKVCLNVATRSLEDVIDVHESDPSKRNAEETKCDELVALGRGLDDDLVKDVRLFIGTMEVLGKGYRNVAFKAMMTYV